jgi:Superfamily I DNA and RNA helicases
MPKNDLQTPEMYKESAASPFESIVADVYLQYQRELAADQAVDFDDLIMLTIQLFKQNPKRWRGTKTNSIIFTWMNIKILIMHSIR